MFPVSKCFLSQNVSCLKMCSVLKWKVPVLQVSSLKCKCPVPKKFPVQKQFLLQKSKCFQSKKVSCNKINQFYTFFYMLQKSKFVNPTYAGTSCIFVVATLFAYSGENIKYFAEVYKYSYLMLFQSCIDTGQWTPTLFPLFMMYNTNILSTDTLLGLIFKNYNSLKVCLN